MTDNIWIAIGNRLVNARNPEKLTLVIAEEPLPLEERALVYNLMLTGTLETAELCPGCIFATVAGVTHAESMAAIRAAERRLKEAGLPPIFPNLPDDKEEPDTVREKDQPVR
jgi:hypothetical protein